MIRGLVVAASLLLMSPAHTQTLSGGEMRSDAENAVLPAAAQNLAVPVSVTSYGARGDVKFVTCNASITSGTATLACPGAAFVAADAGKHIEVPLAGTITNAGGVAAVAVSGAGTGLTSLPSCAITGSGGSGATCAVVIKLLSATVNAGGSGCVGSSGTLTIGGAAGAGRAPQVAVTFSAGAVFAVTSVSYPGALTSLLGTTVAALGGGCSGVTLDLTWGVDSITVGAAGSGYPGGGVTTAGLTGGGGTPATLGAVTVADAVSTLATTIDAVIDTDTLTLGANAGATLSSVSTLVTWGTDSSVAVKTALDANQRVTFPTPAQNPSSPTGIYWVKDIVLNSGNTLEGTASDGYDTEPYSTAINRPILVALQGATTILDPTGKTDVVIRGIQLDGNGTGADCIAANDTGKRIVLDTITATRCNKGFGTAGKYSHVATVINSRFAGNTIGMVNLTDGKVIAGSATGNTSDGVYLGSSAATAFVGFRTEWNGGAGIDCDGCILLNMVGVEFDRNYGAGLVLKGACRGITLTGGWLAENGRNNNMGVGLAQKSHIFVGGTCTRVSLAPGALEARSDVTGSGLIAPAYFLETNTTISSYSINQRLPLVIGNTTAAEVTVGDFVGVGASPIQVSYPFTGTTSAIGGGSVAAGACTSGTVSIPNATTGMAVSADPVTYPGDGFTWPAYVSADGTVTVKVCNYTAGALTPSASIYNVRVIQ